MTVKPFTNEEEVWRNQQEVYIPNWKDNKENYTSDSTDTSTSGAHSPNMSGFSTTSTDNMACYLQSVMAWFNEKVAKQIKDYQ